MNAQDATLKAYLDTAFAQPKPNATWYAWSSAVGTGDGKSWVNACTTITAALALMGYRDKLFIRGFFGDSLVYTDYAAGPWYITIEGIDDAIEMNEWWPAANGAPTINLSCPGWTFKNIRFVGPTDDAVIQLNQNVSAQGANGVRFENCRFYGVDKLYGINLIGAPYSLWVKDCIFEGYTAVGAHAICCFNTAHMAPRICYFENNKFVGNLNHIYLDYANDCVFKNNIFQGAGHGITTTRKLYINDGNDNMIFGNLLGGADFSKAGGYSGGSGDHWLNEQTGDINGSGTDAAGRVNVVVPLAT